MSSSLKPEDFRMPAEWEPHQATWLAWPHNEVTWKGKQLERVRDVFVQIIEMLLHGEEVYLLVPPGKIRENAADRLWSSLSSFKGLHLVEAATRDIWVRDYGPIYVKNPAGHRAWVKWKFNAWGGKYPGIAQDDAVFDPKTGRIADPAFKVPAILEGGSIEVNGAGVCMTSEQCLLNPNRNPSMNREEIEETLRRYLGIREFLWLGNGLAGDDTDGHVDDMARFAGRQTIVAAFERDENDENFTALSENWARIGEFISRKGKGWRAVKVPMPGRVEASGERLPASYLNFYIANQTVLLPVFSVRQDQEAVGIFRDLFPQRRIVPIPCVDLVYGLGAIHCATQQVPA